MSSEDLRCWKEVVVTPNDSAVISPPLRGLCCLVTGSVTYRPVGQSARTITVPYAGFTITSYIDQVHDTNTDLTTAQFIGGI